MLRPYDAPTSLRFNQGDGGRNVGGGFGISKSLVRSDGACPLIRPKDHLRTANPKWVEAGGPGSGIGASTVSDQLISEGERQLEAVVRSPEALVAMKAVIVAAKIGVARHIITVARSGTGIVGDNVMLAEDAQPTGRFTPHLGGSIGIGACAVVVAEGVTYEITIADAPIERAPTG